MCLEAEIIVQRRTKDMKKEKEKHSGVTTNCSKDKSWGTKTESFPLSLLGLSTISVWRRKGYFGVGTWCERWDGHQEGKEEDFWLQQREFELWSHWTLRVQGLVAEYLGKCCPTMATCTVPELRPTWRMIHDQYLNRISGAALPGWLLDRENVK